MALPHLNAVLQRIRRVVGPRTDESASDAELLTAYLAGDSDAFALLVRRHGGMVRGVCRRLLGNVHDADDAFQAVFLVLSRKGGSLTRQENLASWLYGVAWRTAKKVRVAAARRQRREQKAATMTRESVCDEAVEEAVSPALDEELNRLPEKYRLPVLLCYLEGESIEDAARRMRCSAGAVKMRLLRARELLRNRLGRRGLAVSAVALGTLLDNQAASTALPEPQIDLILKAAEAFAAGSASGATGAAVLAQGVIRDMALTKFKLAALVILGLGAVGIGAALAVPGKDRPEPQPIRAQPIVLAAEEKVDKATVAAANNRFGFELLGRVSKPDANAFLSPYSIEAALSMTYAGARGDTAAEMARTLHFSPNQAVWHPAFAALSAELRPGGKEPPYQLQIANRLWGQSGHPFQQAFLKTTKDDYGAEIQPLDFKTNAEAARQTINRWVEEQTKDKIKDLIAKGVLTPDTRLVLTNAIYFKSAWQNPFMPRLTRPEDFRTGDTKVKVPMMHQTEFLGYAETGTYQVASLPYKDNALSMIVVLPKAVGGLAAVEKDLSAVRLDELVKKLKGQRVQVSLPKFKLLESYQLADVLRAMGMPKAFSATQADFTGIANIPGEPLYIGNVIHKALVDVDEKGTEAAAATAVIMRAGAAPQRPAVFKADHPFLFLIRDNRTGTVLFLGRLVKPEVK